MADNDRSLLLCTLAYNFLSFLVLWMTFLWLASSWSIGVFLFVGSISLFLVIFLNLFWSAFLLHFVFWGVLKKLCLSLFFGVLSLIRSRAIGVKGFDRKSLENAIGKSLENAITSSIRKSSWVLIVPALFFLLVVFALDFVFLADLGHFNKFYKIATSYFLVSLLGSVLGRCGYIIPCISLGDGVGGGP